MVPGAFTWSVVVRDALDLAARAHRDQWRIRNGETGRRWHPASHGRTDAPPVSRQRRELREIDTYVVETVTEHRRTWARGVEPVTVEDLAPNVTTETSTVTHDRRRVEITPHRPQDLATVTPQLLPRGDSPLPVPFPARVSRHHYARTYGGAPPT